MNICKSLGFLHTLGSIYQDPHLPHLHIEDDHHRPGQDGHTDQTWGIGNKMSWCRRDSQVQGLSKMTDMSEGQIMLETIQNIQIATEFCWCILVHLGPQDSCHYRTSQCGSPFAAASDLNMSDFC